MNRNVVRRFESIYDHPTLYDVLFSESCKAEIEFLQAVFRRYFERQVGSFFEPACGTGRLLWRLGKRGHEIAGLDLNPKAVRYCNRRLRRHQLPENAIVGDMADFSLVSLNRSENRGFDIAFNLVSSFLHLTTESSARNHLTRIAEALKHRGLYILGLHLMPRGEAACQTECWQVRHGALSLQSSLRRKSLDRRKRLETVEFQIKAKTPNNVYEVFDTFPLRTYSISQFRSLLQATGCFNVLETFDFRFDLKKPIRPNRDTEDIVFVLQKRSQ